MHMLRKYIFALLALFLLGGIVYSYQKFKRLHTPVSPILMAVPEGSALVLETKNVLDLWEKLAHTSVIWENLKETAAISELDAIGQHIDSIIQADVVLKNKMVGRKAMVALAPSGAQRFSLLFAINIPPIWEDIKVEYTIASFLPAGAKTEQKTYANIPFYSVSVNGKTLLHWAIKSGVLLLSAEQIPVEEAIRIMDAPANLLADRDFQKVGKTAGLYADANVYVNYAQWGNFMATLLNERGKSAPFFDHPLASWSALDLNLRSDEVMLNGFVHVPDSSTHYFSIFAGQRGQELEVDKILPVNTAFLLYYGLSHFQSFYQQYQNLLRRQQVFFSYDQQKEALNHRIGSNVEEYCLSWIGREMAVFITEPVHENYPQLSYLAFSAENTENAMEQLQKLSIALGESPEGETYADHQLFNLRLANAYGLLLGAPFDGFDEVFATELDGYLVIAKTKSALRSLINFHGADNTLREDENFGSFTDNLGKRSNLLLYSGISRSPDLYNPFLTKTGTLALDQHLDLVRDFEGAAFQLVEAENGLFYNNFYLRHNPVYTRESGAFWELALDTAITHGPQLVLNHNTESKEIVVQDANHVLHLISNTGKVLWNKKLSGPILGKIQQIDVYKNNKLQLLFNTAEQLYLIDRNGNSVDGYPVKFKSPATAPLGLFDYDQNRNYRILVASEDRQLRLYDAFGKAISEWKAAKTDQPVTDKPAHLRLGTKDYILAVDGGGQVYLLNRRGKHRHRVKTKLSGRSENPYFTQNGKNIQSTQLLYTDTTGNLVALQFDGSEKKQHLIDAPAHHFIAADLNKNQRQEIVITTSEGVYIFDNEGSEICHTDTEGIVNSPVIFNRDDETAWLCVTDSHAETVRMIRKDCKPASGLPLFARGAFALGDINKDGVINLIAIGEPNTIYTYNLE